jgi:hypothetical protein
MSKSATEGIREVDMIIVQKILNQKVSGVSERTLESG